MPEPGNHFIKNQDDAEAAGNLAQALEESQVGQHATDVVRDRLENDRGDLALVFPDGVFHVIEIVEGADQRLFEGLREAPGRERIAFPELLRRSDHVHRQIVVSAVVTPLELDELLPSGGGARQAHGGVGRLGAAVGKQHLLGGGHVPANLFRKLDFEFRRAGPQKIDFLHHAADASVDGAVIVAQHDGTKGGVVVDVIIAVRIRDHGALRAHEDELRPAPSERSVDAPGHDLACGAVSLLTLGEIEHVFSS